MADILPEVAKAPTAVGAQPGISTVLLPWGTPDNEFPALLLVGQKSSGQYDENGNDPQNPTKKLPTWTRVFETISATGETQVGDDDTTVDQDGLTECTQHFIQFSIAAGGISVFSTVGSYSITAPNGVVCVLKEEKRTDDGTLQRIDRNYISSGLISQTFDTKYDGALVITTLTTVNVVPSTPSGATLIDAKTDHVNGLPVYSYTYAKGTGQISTQTEYRLSPDQGTTGVTVTTIKYITTPSVSVNPITGPGGSELISSTMEEQDGYRLWSSIFASGQGTIATNVQYKFENSGGGAPNGAGLVITTITAINAAPSPPSAVVGGTVVLTKADVRNGTRFEDGTKIYEYEWSEAAGGSSGQKISEDVEYLQSIDTGTNGVTRTTLKYITAPGSTIQPTSFGSAILVKDQYTDEDGYRIWETVWVVGQGIVLSESAILEAGVLVTYHIIGLGTAPSAPSATIGGTVTQFEGGSPTLASSPTRIENGWKIFDYRWVEANGQSSIDTRGEGDGALLYEVVTLTASATTPAYPGSGTAYLIDLKQSQEDGYFRNTAVYKKPPASAALSRQVQFRYPGTINILSGPSGLSFNPPVDRDILATETVDYGTSQITTTPFGVSGYASVIIAYTPTNQATPKQTVSQIKAAGGYLSASTSASGTNSIFNGILCDSWSYTINPSTPNTAPTGSTTIKVDNEIYLVDTSGVVVFRRRVTTYTF